MHQGHRPSLTKATQELITYSETKSAILQGDVYKVKA